MDFESALSVEVTVEDHWVLMIARRADQTLVFQGKEARALALVCHWKVPMKMIQSHLYPLANQDVETSQMSEPLNLVKGE